MKEINLLKAKQDMEQTLEIEKMKKQFNEYSDTEIKPNKSFRYYNENFTNLLKSTNVKTYYPIVSCTISYDSRLVLIISKKNDTMFWVRAFDIDNNHIHFEEPITGKFMKCKKVTQNHEGNLFSIVYIDNGKFRLRSFSIKGIEENQGDGKRTYHRS